jgi:hypothetical protein
MHMQQQMPMPVVFGVGRVWACGRGSLLLLTERKYSSNPKNAKTERKRTRVLARVPHISQPFSFSFFSYSRR